MVRGAASQLCGVGSDPSQHPIFLLLLWRLLVLDEVSKMFLNHQTVLLQLPVDGFSVEQIIPLSFNRSFRSMLKPHLIHLQPLEKSGPNDRSQFSTFFTSETFGGDLSDRESQSVMSLLYLKCSERKSIL